MSSISNAFHGITFLIRQGKVWIIPGFHPFKMATRTELANKCTLLQSPFCEACRINYDQRSSIFWETLKDKISDPRWGDAHKSSADRRGNELLRISTDYGNSEQKIKSKR